MSATLGGLEFVSGGGDATYTMASLSRSVATRRDTALRPTAHGAFPAPGLLTGQLITISGLVLASSDAAYEAAKAALQNLLADGTDAELEVTESALTWTAMVGRFDEPDIIDEVYGEVARFRAQFWGADPFRYGDPHTYGPGASFSVSHDGNFDAVPTVTVQGPQSAPYSVASGGHSVTVTQALGSGEEHTIDMGMGWVYLDGVLQSGVTSAVDVFTIPPGAGVTVTGPSTMTVDVVDTYS